MSQLSGIFTELDNLAQSMPPAQANLDLLNTLRVRNNGTHGVPVQRLNSYDEHMHPMTLWCGVCPLVNYGHFVFTPVWISLGVVVV